jgi:hypothetical protein
LKKCKEEKRQSFIHSLLLVSKISFDVVAHTLLVFFFSKGLVGAVADDEPLVLQISRGTGVLERHEAAIVDLCQTPGGSDKEVEDCVVNFLAFSYDTTVSEEEKNDEECNLEDDAADCLIDSMINLWADELPLPPTTSGITDSSGDDSSGSKPKPWSSRSSGSGTFVRDPVTGEMRNIDA